MNHTPAPWHYISGAVYASPEDADRADRCAIAQRANTTPQHAEHIDPTTKDANMRRIVACVNALELGDARAEKVGAAIVEMLSLPRIRYGDGAGRYRTNHGTKTAQGLARTLARILLEA